MRKIYILTGMALIGSVLSVQAADPKTNAKAMDQQAMMAQMAKYATPGANHQVLAQAAGHWTHTLRSWMKPGDPAQESKGTSDNAMVLGGRFLEQRAHGDMNGQPFEGLGYTGYDNIRGTFQSIWMDNMATGMMLGAGSYDSTAKTVKQEGNFSCPMTPEKPMWYRSEWKIVDNDNQTYTLYMKGPDGKEFKSMEIIYKRAK